MKVPVGSSYLQKNQLKGIGKHAIKHTTMSHNSHWCNTALASRQKGGMGSERPETGHNCDRLRVVVTKKFVVVELDLNLVFNILNTANVNSASVNRNQASNLKQFFE